MAKKETGGTAPSSILIIGASRGIGLGLARQYREAGHPVTATVRRKADVKKVVKPQMDELTHAVCYVVNDVLTKNGHTIFGIDFVRKVGTNDFYFFDINTDTISWGKLYPKDHYQIFIDSIHRLLGSK